MTIEADEKINFEIGEDKDMPDLSDAFPGDLEEDEPVQDTEDSSSEGDDDSSADSDKDDSADDPESGAEDGEQEGEEGQADDKEPVQTIDPKLLMEASKLGLSWDDCMEFGSDKALQAYMKFAQREQGSEDSHSEKKEDGKGSADDQQWFELPEMEDVDEELAGSLKKMNEHNKNAFTSMRGALLDQMKEMADGFNARFAAMYESQFNSTVDGLGENWSEVLGNYDDGLSDDNFSARKKLFQAVSRLTKADRESGGKSSLGKLVRQAASLEFPDVAKEQERKELIQKTKSRKKVRRPGDSKQEKYGSDEEGALALIDSWQREHRG